MKIRNPRLLRLAGWGATKLARGLVRTLDVDIHFVGPVVVPVTVIPPGQRYIYAMWHENLLLAVARFGHPDVAALVSKSADGQLLHSLVKSLGMSLVAGSTRRGGVEAVRQLLRADGPWKHIAVTPDGPRGPRRRVQEGVPYLASRTGFSVVPVGIGHRNPWRLKSWDRFAVPRPGGRVRIVVGAPIRVPAGLRTAELELYRQMIESEMLRLTDAAQGWANTNRLAIGAATDAEPLKRAA